MRKYLQNISDKGLISIIPEEVLHHIKNSNTPMQKWTKYLKRCFTKEYKQTANKHMKSTQFQGNAN